MLTRWFEGATPALGANRREAPSVFGASHLASRSFDDGADCAGQILLRKGEEPRGSSPGIFASGWFGQFAKGKCECIEGGNRIHVWQ